MRTIKEVRLRESQNKIYQGGREYKYYTIILELHNLKSVFTKEYDLCILLESNNKLYYGEREGLVFYKIEDSAGKEWSSSSSFIGSKVEEQIVDGLARECNNRLTETIIHIKRRVVDLLLPEKFRTIEIKASEDLTNIHIVDDKIYKELNL